MKRILILILLFGLASLFWLSTTPTPVFAGYCGDGTCGAGEDCYSCPSDCPTCPTPTPSDGGIGGCTSWEGCGQHICPNQVDWVDYRCCPSCDAPDVCQDLDLCPGDPGGCNNDAECFPTNPFCPGDYCEVIQCIDRQCVSDCLPGPCEDGAEPTPTPSTPNCPDSVVSASISTFCTETSYTVTATGINNYSSDIRFPTWSQAGGQDDIIWYVPTNLGGGTFRATINSSSHPGEGIIYTDIWILNPNIYCGGASVTRSCITPTPPPPPPTCDLIADPSSGTAPLSGTLRWETTNNPTSCTASGAWSAPRDPGGGSQGYGPLSAGNYTYNLSCSNAGGTGTCSDTVTVSPCPSAPSISLSSPSTEADDNIVVSWADVANNDSYICQRKPSGGSWTTFATPGANATSCTDTGAKSCGTYQYRVRAVRLGCPVLWSNDSISQIINPPSNAAAQSAGFNVYVSWTDNSGIENSFKIQRRTKSVGGGWSGWGDGATRGANTTYWTDTSGVCGGASPPERVQYRVWCENTVRGCVSDDNWSNELECPLPSCEVTLSPSFLPLVTRQKGPLSANFYEIASGTLETIVFSIRPADPAIATVDPTSVDVSTTVPYTQNNVEVTAGSTEGTTTVTVKGYMDPGNVEGCDDSSTINVTPPEAWFQTQGGDVHAQGGISSEIPDTCVTPGCNPNFSLHGNGGYPGVVSYTGTANFENGYPSNDEANHWLANSTTNLLYSFGYFYKNLGSPGENFGGSIPGSDPNGGEVEIYYSAGTRPIDGGWNIAPGRKIIILVGEEGEQRNANIQGNITVQEGGFLAVIASGHINIEDSLSEIHGIYIADGHISIGEGDVEFTGEGMFISDEKPSLGRNLEADNDLNPAETFIFRPDLWINAPQDFWETSFTWQELAP